MQQDLSGLEAAMAAAYEAWKASRDRQPAPFPRTDPREEAIRDSWSRSGVPGRYRDVEPFGQPVGWTYIWGPVGSGKTTVACRMLRRHMEDTCSEVVPGLWSRPKIKFTTAQSYFADVRAAWGTQERERSLVLRSCDCLVLDDLGQEPPTAWAVEQIFDLVDHRYSENLRTIVTSQFPLDAIEARIAGNGGVEQAEALVSRLSGACRVIQLDHMDRRVA